MAITEIEQVVDAETAANEVDRFCDATEVDVSAKQLAPSYAANRALIERAICRGRMVVSDAGELVYTASCGNVFTFGEPLGAMYMAMDGAKGSITAMYLAMSEWTGKPQGTFSKMRQRDLDVCMAVYGFFS